MPHDTRDAIIDFVNEFSARTEIAAGRYIQWIEVQRGKYYQWVDRYGKANEHNGSIPRDHWLLPWERQAILDFHAKNPLDGYRRLAFMMNDAGIVAVSPTTTWRVLSKAGLLDKWAKRASKKGTGFVQPLAPHEHWHIDIAHINLGGTFYYLCAVLDGCSRAIIHWEIHESMKEQQVEVILQKAKELHPEARPRIISDNGPQFIAGDFKDFIRLSGLSHVRITPYYPQSNGKIERVNRTLKSEAIRPANLESLDDARRVITKFVAHYNGVRLHSAVGYVTPNDILAGRKEAIHAERDRRIEVARELRATRRATERATITPSKVQESRATTATLPL